jgi:hypothetical protein
MFQSRLFLSVGLGSDLVFLTPMLCLTSCRPVTDYLDEKVVQSLKQIHQQVCVALLNMGPAPFRGMAGSGVVCLGPSGVSGCDL